ncbi:MAG: hypothetical protein IIU95_00620, partial [Phascolarctobacterium sp.]|nr:hypothetical protein [Phascolarctobacterium sp.]
VMMEQNPVIERYYEVPLVQKNIAQNMEIFNAPETVTVQVRASRLLLDDDAGKAINAYVDLKGVSEGQQKLHVHATFAKGEVVNILPKDASVFVDHTVEKTVPVVTSVVDNYDEDITVDSNGITPSEAVVRGASSRLSKISKVTAPVSIKDQRGNFQAESVLVPLDDNGKLVSDVHIIPDKATVDAVIVRKMVSAELPVRVVINGELPEGLHIAQMQVLPEKVRVTAPPSVLKNLKEINTKPIDITVLTGSMAINTGLEFPDKVIPAVNEVQVRFSVERQ